MRKTYICSKCKEEPKTTYSNWGKECLRARQKAYYNKNRNKLKAYNSERYYADKPRHYRYLLNYAKRKLEGK